MKPRRTKEVSVAELEEIAREAVDCGFHLHKGLGPGLLESVYEAILADALERRGLRVERQKALDFSYEGKLFREGLRIDLMIEDRLIIELKSVERISPVHAKQLLTYLRLARQPLGLLMNFGAATFREGLQRIVNQHSDFASSQLRVSQNDCSGQGAPEA
jgi:GxxExxY protein